MIETPFSNRLHVGIFGRRNAGKSTLMNALTRQEASIVSEAPGTTTDPVRKAMEIHGLGPVLVTDTGGIDDAGELGSRRVQKTFAVLNHTDVAILVIDPAAGWGGAEEGFLEQVRRRNIPVILVLNKADMLSGTPPPLRNSGGRELEVLAVSALLRRGIDELQEKIAASAPEDFERKAILSDVAKPGELVLMVAPLDIEAPKGRLKLPQVQTMRDVLDSGGSVMMVKESEVAETLNALRRPPKLVIAESQVLPQTAALLPEAIELTTFSILYARYKGDLGTLVAGARAADMLRAGDAVLVAEACTHHPVGDDVGRAVIPRLLERRMGGKGRAHFEFAAGYDFPLDLERFKLVVHCGGCMLNRREMMHRLRAAAEKNVPITNYGVLIAHLSGVLERVIRPFAEAEAKKTAICAVPA